MRTGKRKDFSELTIADDFIFGIVMREEKYCKTFLEIVLNIKIKKLVYSENQKTIDIKKDAKSIRLDVYVDDDEGTVYNIEMQRSNESNIPKRSRYYQGMIDLNLIDKGVKYKNLPKSFVIFVCTFDYYERGWYVYKFENRCVDDINLTFGDGTTKVVLNSKGVYQQGILEKVKNLLLYIDSGKVSDDYTIELENKVKEVKKSEKWRREYMALNIALEDEREQGKISAIINLYKKGIINEEQASDELNITKEEFLKKVKHNK